MNAAGYVIHSAVHAAWPDVERVIHTPTRAATAVSCLAEGLMPLSQTAMRFHGHLARHDYEGPAFNRGERDRLVRDLGGEYAMILRNHGLLACGRPLQHAPQSVIAGTAEALAGMEITLDNEPDTHPQLKRGAQQAGSGYGLLEWPALLRMLDRADSSFRE